MKNKTNLKTAVVKRAHSIEQAPLSVCWDITSWCNENCAFCYRVLEKPDLSLEQHRLILGKLINANIAKISFVGGEPLLVTHLPDLLKESHLAGVITSVVTNGILLKKKWNLIAEYTDWITLPVDGSTEESQTLMTRRKGHLNRVLSLVSMLQAQNKKIKINTVVGQDNISDLSNIAQLIADLKVNRWKIFRFIPIRGYAFKNANDFIITDEDFRSAIDRAMKNIPPNLKCLVTIADKEYLQNNYLSILPDGNVRVVVDERDRIIGSLFEKTVTEIWQSPLFNHGKHYETRNWLIRE